MWRQPFQLELTFFGLNNDYRKHLFEQIHNIVFHGQGGYEYMTVYNMPIWLRNHEYMKISEYYNKPQQEIERKKWEEAKTESKRIQIPSQVYNAKAPIKKQGLLIFILYV